MKSCQMPEQTFAEVQQTKPGAGAIGFGDGKAEGVWVLVL